MSAPLAVSREGRTRIGVIPRTRTGVWSQESVMMTVVTISQGVDPVQELTLAMNSCAGASGDNAIPKEKPDETSPRQNAHS